MQQNLWDVMRAFATFAALWDQQDIDFIRREIRILKWPDDPKIKEACKFLSNEEKEILLSTL